MPNTSRRFSSFNEVFIEISQKDAMLIAHVLWPEIPAPISLASILLCAATIILSGILYGVGNVRKIRSGTPPQTKEE